MEQKWTPSVVLWELYIQVRTLSYGCGRHRKDNVLTEHTEPQRRDEELGEETLLLGVVVRSSEPDSPGMPVPSIREDTLGQTEGSPQGLDIPSGRGVTDGGKESQLLPRPRKRMDGCICNL